MLQEILSYLHENYKHDIEDGCDPSLGKSVS